MTGESTGTMDSKSDKVHKPKKTSNKPKTKTCDIKQESKKSNTVSMKTKLEVKLRPSDIRYSQSSISNVFSDGTNIGDLLDDIYYGRCFASALPHIEVSLIKKEWVSADNRRLWVFKQLEILGSVNLIIVKHVKKIYSGKLTSDNAGATIEIRNGKPAGVLYALLCGESQETNKSATKNQQKRRRSRRRKAKNPNAKSSNLDENQCQSEGELVSSNNLDMSPHDSGVYGDTLTSQLDTLVQYTPFDDADSEELCCSGFQYDSDLEDWFDDLDCILGRKAVSNSAHDYLIDVFDYENVLTTSNPNSHNVPRIQDDCECVSGDNLNVYAMQDDSESLSENRFGVSVIQNDTFCVSLPSNQQSAEHTDQNDTQYEQSVISRNTANGIQVLQTFSKLNTANMVHSEWEFDDLGDTSRSDTSASKYKMGYVQESHDFASSFHSNAAASKVQTESRKWSYDAVYSQDIDELCDVYWCPRSTTDYLVQGHDHESSSSSLSPSADGHCRDRAMVEKTNTNIKQKHSGIQTLFDRFSTKIVGFFYDLFQ